MKKILYWLDDHRLINILLALAFFLTVVVFHDEVTQLALKLRRSMSVGSYNIFFTIATILGFGIWISWLWISVKRSGKRKASYIFLLPTLVLILLFFLFMQTYAIEAVHFFQYAILAVLLFPLLKSYGATVYWATLLGILDEIYQYVILTPTFYYFDFNDILLNLLGAGVAVISIYLTTGISYPSKLKKKSILVVIISMLFLGSLFAILYLGNFIQWYPDSEGDPARWFSINRTPELNTFWTQAYKGKYLHIIRPLEGILISLVLFGYYFMLDLLAVSRR
jgi:hypothetical protein